MVDYTADYSADYSDEIRRYGESQGLSIPESVVRSVSAEIVGKGEDFIDVTPDDLDHMVRSYMSVHVA